LADETGDCATSTELLTWWRSELNNCFQGQARHPVFVALRATIEEFQLPIKPFDDLLAAFLQDQTVKRYEDDDQLLDYCSRSANPVGRIILKLAQVHDPQSDEWSDSICTGLQLANFCQDIQRDAAIGRIYLPRSRWKLSGLDERQIMASQVTEPLRHAVRQWIEDIRPFFYRGQPLLAVGPRWLSRDLQLFIGGGMAILDAIERNRFDVWTRRIEVSRWAKLGLVLQACIRPRSKLQKRNGNR
jgi:squalene synthase HpnC